MNSGGWVRRTIFWVEKGESQPHLMFTCEGEKAKRQRIALFEHSGLKVHDHRWGWLCSSPGPNATLGSRMPQLGLTAISSDTTERALPSRWGK